MNTIVGDLFKSEAQTFINAVNCVGIMGKGIALEFKNHFPDMYEDYVFRCLRKEVRLGKPYLFRTMIPPQIINFPTKDHWKSLSRVEDIERGLKHLLEHYKQWGVLSLALPALGCGNGQLKWQVVEPLIHKYVQQMDISVEVYTPISVISEP